jgi:hypothetical protein
MDVVGVKRQTRVLQGHVYISSSDRDQELSNANRLLDFASGSHILKVTMRTI